MMERILIAAHQRVVLWDGKTQHTILKGHKRSKYTTYYGITWNEEHIFVAESGNARHSTYHVLDGNLERIGELPIGRDISDPHQIYWWDGKLYVASADQDKIVIWDGESCRDVRWSEPGEARKHVNSVWCDGERFYVVEHRYREMPKRIRIFNLEFESIDCIELTAKGFVKAYPRGIHNVYVEDGMLYGCSPKAMYKYNLSSGEHEPIRISRVAESAHRMHGLARVPGRFFIGLSRIAIRSERGRGNSAVLVLDDDLNVMKEIWLKDAGGINEIRAVDGPDLAHNRMRCPFQ